MVTLEYFRRNAGFKKKFAIKQDGGLVDLSAIPGVSVEWHFKDDLTQAKKKIIWDAVPTGSNNHIAGFDVPADFFDKITTHNSSVEVFDAGTLLLHNDTLLLVKIKEPAGIHDE